MFQDVYQMSKDIYRMSQDIYLMAQIFIKSVSDIYRMSQEFMRSFPQRIFVLIFRLVSTATDTTWEASRLLKETESS